MNDYVTGLSGLAGIPGMGCACQSGMNDYVTGMSGYRGGDAGFTASGLGDAAQLEQQAAMAEAGGNLNLANALRTQAQIERSQGIASSAPGSSSGGTSVGQDIAGGIKSFFGGTREVTSSIAGDPLLGPLAILGLSRLVPGVKQNAPPPPPPPQQGWTTGEKVLAGVAGVGLLVGGAVLLSKKK